MKKLVVIPFICLLVGVLSIISCENSPKKLPILGERDFVNGDSVYHQIPEFKFINHDGDSISNKTFEGKIYVSDFFFTT